MTHPPALKIQRSEPVEGVLVYGLAGSLTSEKEAYELLEEIRTRVEGRWRKFVIDLGGVERMTSAGVGILAAAYTSLTRADGTLVLAALPRHCHSILDLVGLLKVMPYTETVEQAVALAQSR